MFRREHHQRIARVLESLNADLLAEHQCWFGGGTALALAHSEYRESLDIDFLVSDRAGYRHVREMVDKDGFPALTRQRVELAREVTSDAYGVRTFVMVDDIPIKFEIVVEGNLELEVPGQEHAICGVRTLTPVDQVATKLLANSDRWADQSTFNRDLIDLAFINASKSTVLDGLAKAEVAYGRAVRGSLQDAIQFLADNPKRLQELKQALKIDAPVPALWSAVKRFENTAMSSVPAEAGGTFTDRERP